MISLFELASLPQDYPQLANWESLIACWHFGGYIETSPATILDCQPPFWLNHTEAERSFFLNHVSAHSFNWQYPFASGYLAAFPQARLVGKGHVVVAGDRRVLINSYSNQQILEQDGFFQAQTLQVKQGQEQQVIPFVLHRPKQSRRTVAGSCLLPTHYWHFNYHHWLVEVLPRLRFAVGQEWLADCVLIVPATLTPFQRESLAILEISPNRWLPFDAGNWQVEKLFFPSVGNFAPAELHWVRQQFLERCLPAQLPNQSRRLYISRADAQQRRLANEREVIAALQPYQFEPVTLTGIPLTEQIRLFAQAEMIVAPHGSGLTNLLFAPSQALVLELMPYDQVNHCFWLMANVVGQPYSFLTGQVVSVQRDFVVSVPRLTQMVEQFLQAKPSL